MVTYKGLKRFGPEIQTSVPLYFVFEEHGRNGLMRDRRGEGEADTWLGCSTVITLTTEDVASMMTKMLELDDSEQCQQETNNTPALLEQIQSRENSLGKQERVELSEKIQERYGAGQTSSLYQGAIDQSDEAGSQQDHTLSDHDYEQQNDRGL